MLAIHNPPWSVTCSSQVANAFAKLSKCQQFTTILILRIYHAVLQTLLQSYQNVSNSQRQQSFTPHKTSCKRFCKVIKMLAIHNDGYDRVINVKLQTLLQSYQNVSNSQLSLICIKQYKVANAFAKLSKCQQFTTKRLFSQQRYKLQTLLQSYQNVSNSQRHNRKCYINNCCKRFCKVIKMLAIHNRVVNLLCKSAVANAFAKLSKCQQFTTINDFTLQFIKLQTLLQSYQNVSNSQQYHSYLC